MTLDAAKPRRDRASTMRDVAEEAGVHVSVVSRYLNRDPRQSISPKTAAAISRAVEDLGYLPNRAARALRTARTQTVALLVSELANPLYSNLVAGVYRTAQAADYSVVLEEIPAHGPLPVERYRQAGFEGLLIAGGAVDEEHLRVLTDTSFPLVVLHQRLADTSWVDANDVLGADLAFGHVFDLGHRAIGVVGGPVHSSATMRRVERLDERAAAGGLQGLPLVSSKGFAASDGRVAALELLGDHPELTCLVVTSSMLAVGAVRAARERNRDVPRDLSIIALTDTEIAQYLTPALTAVQLPTQEIGTAGFELLQRSIEAEGEVVASVIVDHDPELYVRETTAEARP